VLCKIMSFAGRNQGECRVRTPNPPVESHRSRWSEIARDFGAFRIEVMR
jgi:hypothetical protein